MQQLLSQFERNRLADSIRKALLTEQITLLSIGDIQKKNELSAEIKRIETQDSLRKTRLVARAQYLKENAATFPVILDLDTLFHIYTKSGATGPKERASGISLRLKNLLNDDFLTTDSLRISESDFTTDIIYKELVIMGITDLDAMIFGKSRQQLAEDYLLIIKTSLAEARENQSLVKLLTRIGLVLLIIGGVWFLIRIILKIHTRLESFITSNKDKWLKSLSYKDYTFLSAEQELKLVYFVLKLIKWILIILSVYLVIPLIFSIFPFTRGWADTLLTLIWSPFKGILNSVWDFIPNLFTIIVIVVVMRYFMRFVRYIFTEIEAEKLVISGFHADWAMPTFSIVKFLLYAFMFVLIFPYLPGSDSNIFRGVSVFIGVLFSLGSSSAIANIIAGIVITYMRPFKIGDRIKIGDMTGDVIEKTLLVTRLRTPKQEEITIPNSSVLSGNTINYSANVKNDGLIIHTTVTIGYDVPWKDMHKALVDAALQTTEIQKQPQPFVLQTSLDDFYVSYQINAYVKNVSALAGIYSGLHQNIQDVCNERGIEIMSPHYRALREGNTSTIPADQLPEGYEPPSFRFTNK
jgi:small-conductance mechanosensitive channel